MGKRNKRHMHGKVVSMAGKTFEQAIKETIVNKPETGPGGPKENQMTTSNTAEVQAAAATVIAMPNVKAKPAESAKPADAVAAEPKKKIEWFGWYRRMNAWCEEMDRQLAQERAEAARVKQDLKVRREQAAKRVQKEQDALRMSLEQHGINATKIDVKYTLDSLTEAKIHTERVVYERKIEKPKKETNPARVPTPAPQLA